MKKIKVPEKEKRLVKYIVYYLLRELKKEHPKLKQVDSNYFHFIVCYVADKCKLKIIRGWFKNGPYCLAVDDLLVEMGMDKSQHQLYDNKEVMMKKWIVCDCHK